MMALRCSDLLKAVKKHTITAVITLVAILVAVAAFTFLIIHESTRLLLNYW